MQNDPDLWSGCISGAFEDSGLFGIGIIERQPEPWTAEAFKGKEGPCWEPGDCC